MRKILLSLALLTTVTSEDSDTKKLRPLLSEGEPQFWFARGSRFPWDLTHFEFDQSSKDKDVRRLQDTESSLNRISAHDFNRFVPNTENAQDYRSAPDNHQRIDESSGADKRKQNVPVYPIKERILQNPVLNREKVDCALSDCSPHFQSWRLLEPLYVEEPKWVQISSENYDSKFGANEPFFVTRGKRSLKFKIPTQPTATNVLNNNFAPKNPPSDKLKSKLQKLISNPIQVNTEIQEKNEEIKTKTFPDLNAKVIRKRSENDEEKFLTSLEKSLNAKGGTGKSFSYLHPRNKHSDFLEILDEPFFISRGKKSDNYYPIRGISVADYLWDHYLNQHLDKFLSDLRADDKKLSESDKERLLGKIFNNDIQRKRTRQEIGKIHEANAKRNVMDEINLQLDPFYITRG